MLRFYRKRTDALDFDLTRTCKNCGTEFKGRYCPRCGEKVIEPGERSLKSFLSGVLNAFTFIDGKFVHSFKMVVTRPGQLSRDIADGIRVPYMSMISLFFLANFFYFLFPLWDSFNSSLYTHMEMSGHTEQATEMVMKRIEKDHITLEVFTERFESQSTNLSKLLLIFIVLGFAIVLSIINFSKNSYFFDHVLLSLEYNSFQLLVNLLLITYFFFFLIRIGSVFGINLNFLLSDGVFTIIGWLTSGFFFFRSQINFYKQRWYWAAIRTIALIYLYQVVVDVYRLSLFYITMWTV